MMFRSMLAILTASWLQLSSAHAQVVFEYKDQEIGIAMARYTLPDSSTVVLPVLDLTHVSVQGLLNEFDPLRTQEMSELGRFSQVQLDLALDPEGITDFGLGISMNSRIAGIALDLRQSEVSRANMAALRLGFGPTAIIRMGKDQDYIILSSKIGFSIYSDHFGVRTQNSDSNIGAGTFTGIETSMRFSGIEWYGSAVVDVTDSAPARFTAKARAAYEVAPGLVPYVQYEYRTSKVLNQDWKEFQFFRAGVRVQLQNL